MECHPFHLTNKFVFVNRNVVQNQPQQAVSSKILINPNFKQNVYVNPHFNRNVPVVTNTSIFINPNIVKQTTSTIDSTCIVSHLATPSNVSNISNESRETISQPLTIDRSKGAVIKNTKTKLIRATRPNILKVEKDCNKSPIRVRQKLCTRYKLVRRSISKDSSKVEDAKKSDLKDDSNAKKFSTRFRLIRRSTSKDWPKMKNAESPNVKMINCSRNKYKIDRSSHKVIHPVISPTNTRKLIRKGQQLYDFSNPLDSKSVYIKRNSLNKTQLVNINSILYKSSPNKLKLKKTNRNSDVQVARKKKGGKIITIRGQKYKLDTNHRTLTSMSANGKSNVSNIKKIGVGRVTFTQAKANSFVKTNINRSHIILSQAKHRSINILVNKMKKCNLPCPFYRKFGRCRGKERGTCSRVHNPDQISLCSKFLQGACVDDKCLLSHKVSPEKMPTCKFFLEGLCTREDCPYLHVKINAKADICRDFLRGFCEKGKECDKRHQYLCPDYEKYGECVNKRCSYPHGNVVRKRRISIKVAPKSSKSRKINRNLNSEPRASKLVRKKSPDKSKISSENNNVKTRYYVDSRDSVPENSTNPDNLEVPSSNTASNVSDIGSDSPLIKRPKVGDLPSFIPFENNC